MIEEKKKIKYSGLIALTPLVVFLLIYMVASVYLGDFYKIPITVAFLISSIYAVAITGGLTLNERIVQFGTGAGSSQIMIMIWIFILAGGFASSAKGMGAVDATVGATLRILPESLLLPGLFLASCFISLSIGTSVGTIAALTPVAVGIAAQTSTNLPMTIAIVAGGAFFGDNLSFISDTTIVATQTLGCQMKDKFRANVRIAVPAAIIVLVIYSIMGQKVHTPTDVVEADAIKVIPYLVVLIAALWGANVVALLCVGIALTGIVGIWMGAYDFFEWLKAVGDGIVGMGELIIVTMLAGGMLELIRYNGGIDYIVKKLSNNVSTSRGGMLIMALLVVISVLCTANNTIAIITVGPIAKKLTEKYNIDRKRAASVLDSFSCFTQGLIPYGAQLLIAAGIANIAPVEIATYMFYPLVLGLISLLYIFWSTTKHAEKK